MSKIQIIKGTTFGQPQAYSELVGYDSDTGEEIYEEMYEASFNPHEDIIGEFNDYNIASEEYDRIIEEFMNTHQWPWNEPHFEGIEGGWRTEFTDNEDSYWFILKEVDQHRLSFFVKLASAIIGGELYG